MAIEQLTTPGGWLRAKEDLLDLERRYPQNKTFKIVSFSEGGIIYSCVEGDLKKEREREREWEATTKRNVELSRQRAREHVREEDEAPSDRC